MNAKFVFWMGPDDDGHFPAVPYYNLLKQVGIHPKGTTISDVTIRKIGEPIPLTPTYDTYLKLTASGERCRYCFAKGSCNHKKTGGQV